MKKRIVVLLLTLSMIVGTLAACGKTDDAAKESASKTESTSQVTSGTSAASSADSSEETSDSGEDSKFFDGEGKTLHIGIATERFITDYENNAFTNYLEEKLNINLEFTVYSETEWTTQFSLAAASGETLPDVLCAGMSLGDVSGYGEDGIFVPLNEYLDNPDISPNWYAIPEEDRATMLSSMTSTDGNIYGLANYYVVPWNYTPYRMYINDAWLDKLGLEAPTTTDELYTVLKAFRDEDPNGNGIKDEIPLYGFWGGYGQNILWAVMNSFTYFNGWHDNNGLAIDENGQVYAPYSTDEWREGLEYMRMLNQEGLLSSSVFTDDHAQFRATLAMDPYVVGITCTGSCGDFGDWTAEDSVFMQEIEQIKPIAGPDGIAYTPYEAASFNCQWMVTADCEDPEFAYRVGEAFYETETSIWVRHGERDVNWTDDPEVLERINTPERVADNGGIPYAIASINIDEIWAGESAQFWHDKGPRYTPSGFAYSADEEYDPESKVNRIIAGNTTNYLGAHPDKILPIMSFSEEDSDTLGLYAGEVYTIMTSHVTSFITGSKELNDANWNKYLETLDDAGLGTLIEITQKRYNEIYN